MRQGKLILILLCLPILKTGTLPAVLDFIYTRLPTYSPEERSQDKLDSSQEQNIALFF